MSAVQNVGAASSQAASQSGTKTQGLGTAQETQDRFLKLLVTQIKNQDPLNPLDNAQVTAQMAQLSTVSGIEKLNATMQSLATSFMTSQTLQAAGLVGHGVMAAGSKVLLDGGSAIGGVELQQPVDKLLVTIKDAAGNALHSVDLGPQKTGLIPFQWDGATDSGGVAPDGAYSFEVSASQGGNKVTTTSLTFGQVGSVSLGTQGLSINVNGLGALALSDVKQIM